MRAYVLSLLMMTVSLAGCMGEGASLHRTSATQPRMNWPYPIGKSVTSGCTRSSRPSLEKTVLALS